MSVSNGNNFEVIDVQPFLRVIILSPEWRFRDSGTILYQVVLSLFPQFGEFFGDGDEYFRLGRHCLNFHEVVEDPEFFEETFKEENYLVNSGLLQSGSGELSRLCKLCSAKVSEG